MALLADCVGEDNRVHLRRCLRFIKSGAPLKELALEEQADRGVYARALWHWLPRIDTMWYEPSEEQAASRKIFGCVVGGSIDSCPIEADCGDFNGHYETEVGD
jgi:hypothetical protein